MKPIYLLFLSLFYYSTCIAITPKQKLKQGSWHAELQVNDSTFLPFFMEYNQDGLTIINDEEKITVASIDQKEDSLVFNFPIFNSYCKVKVIDDKNIRGYWYYPVKGPDYKIPFSAYHGTNDRFERYASKKEPQKIYSKYEIVFGEGTEDEFPALGTFKLNADGKLTGTFLTETGDFRFLSGNVYGDHFYLSTFDGAHAFVFVGKINGEKLEGHFYSGVHYNTHFTGQSNPDYELTDPSELTRLRDGFDQLYFTLNDLEGKSYSFPNDQTLGKVVIIQIMGSWCPNCKDETAFYKELKDKYGDAIEVISVGFETGKTFEEKANAIHRLKDYFETDFTYLVGGYASKKESSEVFPMLTDIISYPTSVFIDQAGKVALIHTGFSGPGTGAYYTNYKKKIYTLLDRLTN